MPADLKISQSEYYLISTWLNKRKVNTIRYYFDLKKAEDYLKTLK